MDKDHVIHVITQIVIDKGEGLLNDTGVDYQEARKIAEEVLKEMKGFIDKETEVASCSSCEAVKDERADRDEVLAELGYMAGWDGLTWEDSRAVIAQFVEWGETFQKLHKDTNWDHPEKDYMSEIQSFYEDRKKEVIAIGWEWTMREPKQAKLVPGQLSRLNQFLLELRDPDTIGSAEYRAIHELVKEAESIEVADAILQEFQVNANVLRERIKKFKKK